MESSASETTTDAAAASERTQLEVRTDVGLYALSVIAKFHGIATDHEHIRHHFSVNGDPLDEEGMLLAARKIGLKARFVNLPARRLENISLPALAWQRDGRHFIITRCDSERVLAQSFENPRPELLTREQFASRYQGRLMLVTSRASGLRALKKFDFRWFVPLLIKYRHILVEVLVISFFIQLIGLCTPLLFQVVMDKVLVHHTLSTLNVIASGVVLIAGFEVALTCLRNYIFTHTTSKVDVELGAIIFRHIINLPLSYFESRRVGEIVARVRELESVRGFLTGQALTTVLDLMFTSIFIAVMLIYSGWLSLIVIASLPVYAIWSASITPVIRRRLDDKFLRNAENQSFLVEAVNGISTIKASSVVPHLVRTWDNQLAGYVQSSFRVSRLANIGQQGVQLIQKLVGASLLYAGAKLVISGELTLGQLIAFNMLAGQVASPIIRLAQLWQDFQQVGVSVERLGDILNAKGETERGSLVPPRIIGGIQFKGVGFRYEKDVREALTDIDLKIEPGEVIGIVGRSGSGKSTLTKLIQRLYFPTRGQVLVDGSDISVVDPGWLRRQLGVVLQENFLFNRSIRDNISLGEPGASFERVIASAKLAGAHEFIQGLPQAYDTKLGDNGAGLSGGQRQRIAIARALITNPRILILDEATSALDYESERAVMVNMREICKGRTVLIIAHRLSTVRKADRIVVIDEGRIIERGSHDELIASGGAYRSLYELQSANL